MTFARVFLSMALLGALVFVTVFTGPAQAHHDQDLRWQADSRRPDGFERAGAGRTSPDEWRDDYRRPDDRFEGMGADRVRAWLKDSRRPDGWFGRSPSSSKVAPWRDDYRRPDGWFEGGGGHPDAWRVDSRRAASWFQGRGSAPDVYGWQVDDRRPGRFPREQGDADQDGDGVPDFKDQCPDTPRGADVDVNGCPKDSDGDGVLDGLDRCPDTPRGAEVDNRGCPKDSDGDGVFDGLDRCPDTPRRAEVDNRGCPKDSDGDGVYDGIDECPGTPSGVEVDDVGCPVISSQKEEELLNTGTLSLENVFFETASAELKRESYPVLDEVGVILRKWPQLRIEVGGHTDSRGAEDYNQDLSERRAASVMNYLTSSFQLKRNQLTSRGYGESLPVATNATADGQTKNRRVEFKVLNREVLKQRK